MQTFTRRRFLESSTSGVAALGLGVASLYSQDWARKAVDQSPRRREWVSIKQGSRSVESMVAHPQTRDKAPAMVVIHEIFGMTDWVENVTDEFAEAGYIAVAPDLLSGMAPNGGRTKDFPATEGGGFGAGRPGDHEAAARSSHGGSQSRGRVLQEPRYLQWKGMRGWIFMGRQPVFPTGNQLQRSVCRIRILWRGTRTGSHPVHSGAGLWLLCRERCARQRIHSANAGADEGGWQVF